MAQSSYTIKFVYPILLFVLICSDLFDPFTTCLPYNALHTNNRFLCYDSFNKSLKTEMTPLSTSVLDALPLHNTHFSPVQTDTLFETQMTRSSESQTLHEILHHVFTDTFTETQISTSSGSIPRTITSVPICYQYDALHLLKTSFHVDLVDKFCDKIILRSSNQPCFELSNIVFSNNSNNAYQLQSKYDMITADIQ
jgi:hypothetical protein